MQMSETAPRAFPWTYRPGFAPRLKRVLMTLRGLLWKRQDKDYISEPWSLDASGYRILEETTSFLSHACLYSLQFNWGLVLDGVAASGR